MRKADMGRRLADETALTQVKATEVVETIFDEIKSSLEQGDAVILRGFGSFHVRDKHGRIGRNAHRKVKRFFVQITVATETLARYLVSVSVKGKQ